ncbi:MptD family putative ECF transporter S component [Clostridium cochlearium]|uniref:Uncharacterized protein n=1 Tax=Clostridium cochlearium TaxID=1494 RepID=A0A7Y3Y0L9_CLOCO|nr:hypothetical protein [Clostridium cochlearium]
MKNFPGMFTPEAIDEMSAIYYNPKTVIIMIIVTGIFALIGASIGLGIYKKFFNKKNKK